MNPEKAEELLKQQLLKLIPFNHIVHYLVIFTKWGATRLALLVMQ